MTPEVLSTNCGVPPTSRVDQVEWYRNLGGLYIRIACAHRTALGCC